MAACSDTMFLFSSMAQIALNKSLRPRQMALQGRGDRAALPHGGGGSQRSQAQAAAARSLRSTFERLGGPGSAQGEGEERQESPAVGEAHHGRPPVQPVSKVVEVVSKIVV